MEHFTQLALEPAKQLIENLFTFPAAVLSESAERKQERHKQLHSRLELKEKEEELEKLQSSLIARTAALQEKELLLSERWDAGRIYAIAPSEIAANPYQPRREFDDISLFSLANSIREHGILQPLTVRRIYESDGTTISNSSTEKTVSYQLIAGERRLRAAIAIGMETVPCIILDADNRRAAELALIENLQRENLNMFEQAGAIAALIDMHAMTQEEIARTLSVSQSCIANKLRLLRLTSEERDTILCAHLTERHARAFLRIKDLEQRRQTVRTVSERGFNVSQTEEYIDSLLTTSPLLQTISASENEVQQKNMKQTPRRQNKKCILKDLRLFFNTIEHAVTAAREAGFQTDSTRTETDDSITLTVTIRTSDSTLHNTAQA